LHVVQARKRYLTDDAEPLEQVTRSVNGTDGAAEPLPLKLAYAMSLPSGMVLPLPARLGVVQVVGGGGGVETWTAVLTFVVRNAFHTPGAINCIVPLTPICEINWKFTGPELFGCVGWILIKRIWSCV